MLKTTVKTGTPAFTVSLAILSILSACGGGLEDQSQSAASLPTAQDAANEADRSALFAGRELGTATSLAQSTETDIQIVASTARISAGAQKQAINPMMADLSAGSALLFEKKTILSTPKLDPAISVIPAPTVTDAKVPPSSSALGSTFDYLSAQVANLSTKVGLDSSTRSVRRKPDPAPAPLPVVPPAPAPAPAPGMIGMGPTVNAAKIPLGARGSAVDMLLPTTDIPKLTADGTGDFRTICTYSHMNFDDPIVFPGQPGLSHLHAYFGNTGTNGKSTAASLLASGNSTCRGGTINRSAYWQPAIIDTKDGAPVRPRIAIIYYKSAAFALAADIKPIPQGLRMIAGDPKGNAPVLWGPTIFSCNGEPVGSDRNFPPTPSKPGPHSIPNCSAGTEVWASVIFPRCWDGVNLDSPDHKSHMAYWPIPNPYVDATHPMGKCPPSHPVTLPEVTITAVYPVTEMNAPLRWRLASDMYDTSIPAGYSLHADWFGGWRPEIVDIWTKNCINPAKDCSAHMVGDGRMMLDVGM